MRKKCHLKERIISNIFICFISLIKSFVYLYYATFIARPSFLTHDNNSLDAIYDLALGNLSPTEQCLLAQKLNSGSNIQNCMSMP